jgi:hypothetical protein
VRAVTELPYVVTDEPAWWADRIPAFPTYRPGAAPSLSPGLLAAAGHYNVPIPVVELPALLRRALHGSPRLVATRIDDDSAEVRRRTTLAARADLLHVRYVERGTGSTLDVRTSQTVFAAETRLDVTAFFEAIRVELQRGAEAGGSAQ